MGRSLRPNDEGLTFHALSRGNNGDAVFLDDGDFHAFLHALARTQLRYPFRLYGYCLMTNHFHLLLRPEAGVAIGRIMQSLLVAHTWRYHKRHQSLGHVWQGRFKSPPVQEDDYLWTVLRYIEANPVRAGMVADPRDYPWSSYQAHGVGRADPLLSEVPGWSALGNTPVSCRRAWRSKVAAVLTDPDQEAIRASLISGRPYGETDWVESQTTKLGLHPTQRSRGRPRKMN